MWGKALWRLYKIIVTIGIAIIIALIAFSISMFDLKAQSPYFHTSQSDIEKVAKKDSFRVSTEILKTEETMNIIYHLTKDSIVIRVGYLPDMDKPAWINYREEN